jgi:hypothetical protein
MTTVTVTVTVINAVVIYHVYHVINVRCVRIGANQLVTAKRTVLGVIPVLTGWM